jgi:hypothetical protein
MNQSGNPILNLGLLLNHTGDKILSTNLNFTYQQNITHFNSFDNIVYDSYGISAGVDLSVLKYLYIGGRLGLSYNNITYESRDEYLDYYEPIDEANNTRNSGLNLFGSHVSKAPTVFIGTDLIARAGSIFPITDYISIKLQGELGFTYANILEDRENIFSANNCLVFCDDYSETRFIRQYNISLGLILRLSEF